MASPKEAALPHPLWDTESVSLKDFLMTHDQPCVSKVVKGQFLNIGASRFSPLKKLHQEVLVHSIKTGLKVLGHSMSKVDSRDGRTHKLLPLEQRVSIPMTYKGWFELVSENGRIAKPIENVRDLAKLFPVVNNVLVRHNIKAYHGSDRDGMMTFDKTKVVIAGEQLKIVSDLTIQTPSNIDGLVRLLKCTDVRGDALYLSFDQRGLFTPIANETDVTGVFLIKDIINRFRLPLTVKLVQGVWPKVDTTRFTGLIRLDWAYTDEIAFVCPLDRTVPRIYPIPTEVSLRLVTAINNEELKVNEAFTNIMVKCNRLVSNYHNTIHLIISVPEGVMKTKSHSMANMYSDTNSRIMTPEKAPSPIKRSKSKEDILHDELDDLYGYLRVGKQPPVGKYTRTRDSDEETYYEEPEFEPMTKFRSRVEMLDNGDVNGSKRNTHHTLADPRSVLDANHNRVVVTGRSPPKETPPELPPRQYSHTDSSPVIHTVHAVVVKVDGTLSSSTGSGSSPGSIHISTPKSRPVLPRKISSVSMTNSHESKSSSDGKKDTDSKGNKSSSSGSAKKMHRKSSMPLLYL